MDYVNVIRGEKGQKMAISTLRKTFCYLKQKNAINIPMIGYPIPIPRPRINCK